MELSAPGPVSEPAVTEPAVAGVLLAAGLSTRMGRPKQLAALSGQPLCLYAARAMAGAGHAALLAVMPPGEVGQGVRAALSGLPFTFAVNPDPARGLASSFRTALEALEALEAGPTGFAAVNFALADMPLVTAELHRALLEAFRDTGAPVVLAEYGDSEREEAETGRPEGAVRAPPHLFRADVLRGVRNAPDADHGPRHLIRQYAAQAVTLRFPAALLLDVDTPEALALAEARLP